MARLSISNEALITRPLQGEHGMQQCLPVEIGIGYSKSYQLDSEMAFIETCFRPSKNLAVLSQTESDEPRMVVTFGLQGRSRFLDHKRGELIFKPGYAVITTFSSSKGERQYEADDRSLQLRVSLSKTGLEKLFGASCIAGLFTQPGMHLLGCHPMSSYSVMAMQQLSACTLTADVKPVFMRGIAISALASELNSVFKDTRQGEVKFSCQDQDKAMMARAILSHEFRAPPSVAQLAKRVGTNQLKLKQLFHHYFNSTPYGLLFEIRMKHASQLLESGHYHVNTIADRVGYRHASNFSAAFSKYYGISPKQIARRRV